MQKVIRSARPALVILTGLALGACETLPPSSSKPSPDLRSFVENVPRVKNSPAAPCWQQKEIAAQNAYLDSVLAGKPRSYHAPCLDKKPTPAEPKTS